MKSRLTMPVVLVSVFAGLCLSAFLQGNSGCQSFQAPTTQQADALVAEARADVAKVDEALTTLKAAAASQPTAATLQQELAAAKAAAASQPANADLKAQVDVLNQQLAATNALNKQIATLTTVMAGAQKGVTIATGVDQAVYHGDPSAVSGLVATGVSMVPGGAPYAPLAALAVTLGWGLLQNRKAAASQSAHADTTAALDATTAALQQYAQAVHSIAPDAIVHSVSATVDSATRAAVASAGVVHVPDAAPVAAAVATLQPAVAGTYPLPLSPTNAAGH